MLWRIRPIALLALLVLGAFASSFHIQPVSATGTIYIRADGSIDPPYAHISSLDNITYTFAGNINDSIVIERDSIVIDGAGHTVQGAGFGKGIDLTSRSNATVKNTQITAFNVAIWLYMSSGNILSGNNITTNVDCGIRLWNSSDYNSISGNNITNNDFGIEVWDFSDYNIILGNNITGNGFGIFLDYSSQSYIYGNRIEANNRYGIRLMSSCYNNYLTKNNVTKNEDGIELWGSSDHNSISSNKIANNDGHGIYLESSYNSISYNNITSNNFGIYLYSPSNNTISHNNFINNIEQAQILQSFENTWDDGYPYGGNYWSDHNGTDLFNGPAQNLTGSDGICDQQYMMAARNQDHYPLLHSWNGLPDLSVDHIDAATYSPREGQPVDISVTVRNVGGSDSRYGYAYLVQRSWYLTPIENGNCIWSTVPLASIPVNGVRVVHFLWNATEILNVWNESLMVGLSTALDQDSYNDWAYLGSFNITGTSGFHANTDGYSFPNWGVDSREEAETLEVAIRSHFEEGLRSVFPQWPTILTSIFARILTDFMSNYSSSGHCYGMAATSILYYLNSIPRPVDKETFQMLKNESIPNIESYFAQQVFHALNYLIKEAMSYFGISSLRDEYAKIVQSIQAGRPLMLIVRTSLGGHAVTAFNTYNVSENLKNVVVYDNNYPGMGITYTFDLQNGKVYSPTYEITYVYADSPAPYSVDLIRKIVSDFLDNIFGVFKRILAFHSPVNVTISDQLNRTISDSLNEIPDAIFEYYNLTDTRVFYLPLNSSYSVKLRGYDAGNCTITQFVPMDNLSASSSTIEFKVNSTTSAGFEMPLESANFTLGLDGDGDGFVDEEKAPDLVTYRQYVSVTSATIAKTYVGRGTSLPINVTMANPSNYTLTFNASLYVNQTAVQTQLITLPNSTSSTFTFVWNTTGFDYGNYDVVAVADTIPGETSVVDNNMTCGRITVTMLGDMTGPKGVPDGRVDMRDVSAVAKLFGAGYHDLRYNGNCDIDDDGKIDMKDISTVAKHFGEHYP